VNRFAYPLSLTIAIFAAVLAIVARDSLPDVKGSNAPLDEFAAARAIEELKTLLGDQQPHPSGSHVNAAVRERLIARLGELGLAPTTQTAIGCNQSYALCGTATNVLATIPGKRESGILLMAHYDSVPFAPGAGDDGAGVAALIEIARVLRHDSVAHENSVMFLFTDAEEDGLLGAEAFFAEHPAAKLAKVVFNLEGSGSSGPVLVLRVGPNSGDLVDLYRSHATHPRALSFVQELFKRLPNDTDFSISSRANLPGIDLAFAGERNHYHSPLDSIEMLDPRTVQHHGDSVLPLVSALLDSDLDTLKKPNYVFATQPGGWWVSWSISTGVALSIAAILLLALASWCRRRDLSLAKLFGGVGGAVLVFVLVLVFEFAVFWLSDRLAGTRVAWPANPWPWRLLMYAAPLLAVVLTAPLLARRLGVATAFGCWWLWAILALLLVSFMPLAGHLLLPMTLVASIVMLVSPASIDRIASLLLAGVAAFALLPLVPGTERSNGLQMAPVMFVPLALLATTLTPLAASERRMDARTVFAASTAALVVGLAWSAVVPLYSEMRPQHLVIGYELDADSGATRFVTWSPNPLPPSVSGAAAFQVDQPRVPWSDDRSPAAAAPALAAVPPELIVLDDGDDNPKTRRLLLQSHRDASELLLVIPVSAGVESIRVNGHPTGRRPFDASGYLQLLLVNPPDGRYTIDLELATDGKVEGFLADRQRGLPDVARPLADARGKLAVPVHDGDSWLIFRRIVF
jgi:hypothetical protein